MRLLLLLLLCVRLFAANEHWFVFDRYQFPGFSTFLFTLISSSINQTDVQDYGNLSFSLSTYERAIVIDIGTRNVNGTVEQREPLIKLSIDRADLVQNTANQMIFVAVREQRKIETYVNCKLIDSYVLYSPMAIDANDNVSSVYSVQKMTENIDYYRVTATNGYKLEEIFETFSCKQTGPTLPPNNETTPAIGQPLIRQMQQIIDEVQRRQPEERTDRNRSSSGPPVSDTLTIVYKPHMDRFNASNSSSFHPILYSSQDEFHVQYYPNDRLFQVRFDNENRTQFVLYADKANDRLLTAKAELLVFLHIAPTKISCYVNCELTDQEFITDSSYVRTALRQIMNSNRYEYNRASTLILSNRSIEQLATSFFCSKLDQKNEEPLPDKYALRKFTNALDLLINSIDSRRQEPSSPSITSESVASTGNVSTIDIPSINGFGSLRATSFSSDVKIERSFAAQQTMEYDKLCSTDDDCSSRRSLMVCLVGHCTCPRRLFWSSTLHRCTMCHDVLIGKRCFRLSNHKSTWYEANESCQNENSIGDAQEYTMRLASNLNRTDIQYVKQEFLHDSNLEQFDYIYWIGATTRSETRPWHSSKFRYRRQLSPAQFQWYDNGEPAAFNRQDMWCSQTNYQSLARVQPRDLCVSITSCGLYADDCERSYRFLCESV